MGEKLFTSYRFIARFFLLLSSISAMILQMWNVDGSKLFYLSVLIAVIYAVWMILYDIQSFIHCCWPELLFSLACFFSIITNQSWSDEYSYIRLAEVLMYLFVALINPGKSKLTALTKEKDFMLYFIIIATFAMSAGSLLFQILHSMRIFTLTWEKITYFSNGILAGLYNNGNQAGIYGFLGFMLSYYYWVQNKDWKLFISMIVQFVMIMLSGSRTMLIVLPIVALILMHQGVIFQKLTKKQRFLIEIFAIVGGIILILQVSVTKGQYYWYTDNSLYHVLDRFLGSRLDLWSNAMQLFLRYPFFGVGLNNIHAAAQDLLPEGSIYRQLRLYENPHNTIVSLLAYTGIAGTAAYLLMAVKYIKSLWSLKKDNPDRILIAMCCGLAIGDLSDIILIFNHRIPVFVFTYVLGYLWLKQRMQSEAVE